MTFNAILRHKSTKAALVGAMVALMSWQVSWRRGGQLLANVSFDLPFSITEFPASANIVLVELDEISHADLHLAYGDRWDRRLHARLLDHLRSEGASLVVFDIVFTDAGSDASADQELARAIRAHGRVVLAADLDHTHRNGIVGPTVIAPNDLFRAVTTNWGPTEAEIESDGVVRRIYGGTEQKPSMTWVAAALADGSLLPAGADHLAERWIRCYGPERTITHVSYSLATNQPPGFYRGKTVFIGGRPKTQFVGKEVDSFRTPRRLHGAPQISGLELTATEFLNLSRGEYLTRLPEGAEFALLVCLGILAGAGLASVRPWRAVLLAVAGVIAVMALAFLLFFNVNLWFNWAVAALVQIPCALAWSLGWQWWLLKKEKDWLETPMPNLWDETPSIQSGRQSSVAAAASLNDEQANPPGLPAIPDHELLRLVGRGAYGDVWLARNILGSFHAVKIIRRAAFDHADPYDREFRGLQKFTPISRAHHGLVNILHVGRNSAEDCFYYVMEAGDDETTGAKIDPATYTPRNLGRDLRRRGPLRPAECVAILSELCEALEFLHGLGLIHRDIKPANIIFVNGRPKLADIGLVTEMSDTVRAVSNVGTEGYLPPEGPGTRAGDVFALGKVLEEMLRPRVPAGSPASDEVPDCLRAIILKACAENPADRFTSARQMREAVVGAREKITGNQPASGVEN